MAKIKKNIEVVSEAIDEGKKLIATKTISILAGSKTYQLTQGEEIPSDISEELAKSLKNSNLIK